MHRYYMLGAELEIFHLGLTFFSGGSNSGACGAKSRFRLPVLPGCGTTTAGVYAETQGILLAAGNEAA